MGHDRARQGHRRTHSARVNPIWRASPAHSTPCTVMSHQGATMGPHDHNRNPERNCNCNRNPNRDRSLNPKHHPDLVSPYVRRVAYETLRLRVRARIRVRVGSGQDQDWSSINCGYQGPIAGLGSYACLLGSCLIGSCLIGSCSDYS